MTGDCKGRSKKNSSQWWMCQQRIKVFATQKTKKTGSEAVQQPQEDRKFLTQRPGKIIEKPHARHSQHSPPAAAARASATRAFHPGHHLAKRAMASTTSSAAPGKLKRMR